MSNTAVEAISEARLEHVKAGDRVWIGTTRYGRKAIKTVAKVTRTQVVLDWNGNGKHLPRYYKTGYRPGHQYLNEEILGVATAEECEAWDAEQAEKQRERERNEAEKERIEAKRQELHAAFSNPNGVWIGHMDKTTQVIHGSGTWQVNLSGLTDEQVLAVARFMSTQEPAR